MPVNSFKLYATTRTVRAQLQRWLQAVPAAEPRRDHEVRAALAQIDILWDALREHAADLTAERQRNADFFEFAPEAYLITEPLGEIREANRAARELLGASEAELEGTLLSERVPQGTRAAFRARLIEARGEPESELREWEGALDTPSGARAVLFKVRSIKVRRKNADGLCWAIRPLRHGEATRG
jgi:PAS domain S-box-containing protein